MRTDGIEIGARFGRWTVVGGPHREKRVAANSTNYIDVFDCVCDCGTARRVRKHKLIRNSRSCGCGTAESIAKANTTHGHTTGRERSRLYSVWLGMKDRCADPTHSGFQRYGGRGIAVCPEWESFPAFAKWADANGYDDRMTIDREDNDGDYSPGNCRFVSLTVNARNKAVNVHLTAFGETKCLTDWALDARCSVTPSTIMHRIRRLGMSVEEAIASPRRTQKGAARFRGHHVKS